MMIEVMTEDDVSACLRGESGAGKERKKLQTLGIIFHKFQ